MTSAVPAPPTDCTPRAPVPLVSIVPLLKALASPPTSGTDLIRAYNPYGLASSTVVSPVVRMAPWLVAKALPASSSTTATTPAPFVVMVAPASLVAIAVRVPLGPLLNGRPQPQRSGSFRGNGRAAGIDGCRRSSTTSRCDYGVGWVVAVGSTSGGHGPFVDGRCSPRSVDPRLHCPRRRAAGFDRSPIDGPY